MEETKNCITCNEPLKGKFCYNCGEKVVEKSDFSIKTILQQFVDGFTNFDSKFIKSFWFLLFKPGQLTENYVNGIRKPFMKPFQLFIVANVLFFLILSGADIFRIPSDYFFSVETNLKDLEEIVSTKLESVEVLKQVYDTETLTNSKLYIFILIPFLSLMIWLVNFKKKLQFGIHAIFAIHYLSFFMLFCITLIVFPESILTPTFIKSTLFSFNFIYLAFAIKRFYSDNWKITFLKTLVIVLIFFALIFLYREQVSQFTFYLMRK